MVYHSNHVINQDIYSFFVVECGLEKYINQARTLPPVLLVTVMTLANPFGTNTVEDKCLHLIVCCEEVS